MKFYASSRPFVLKKDWLVHDAQLIDTDFDRMCWSPMDLNAQEEPYSAPKGVYEYKTHRPSLKKARPIGRNQVWTPPNWRSK